ncbi:MAG: type IV secretion system DNA-binding domain-containing protein [Methanocellales archaeon]|nr:type IV secretion system DNA-binding domain-containing protein [Methanocellales archaeon]MDD3292102.1 type IV secretion system DNA-binding domain-containing protein [Methanocellales archaeon]MDD5235339.1 type IV secretion system DNA-binding domain-containing protein [Methanocellales archaeon]MDD5485713.1 type IV secretion system DNA-binding domain-containing protein [Methanocellales archaeon]
MSKINFFAKTNFRGEGKVFGIKKEDRRLHMYVIGKTGMGKTSLLLNMILNDIYGNEGVCFIDPHGDAVERVLDYIPKERINDIIYFNPADVDHPIALNVLEKVEPGRRHLLVSGLISVFRKLYAEYWHHRQEHILRNTILALLDYPGNKTLLDVYRMLNDWRYRKEIVDKIKDPIVRSFWKNEFPKYLYQFKGDALTPIQNKLGGFLSTPLIRNIVGRAESKIDFRWVMDKGKILLVNLAKGKIGEDNSSLLGSLIITKLQLAAMSRINIPEEQRKDFYLFVDEFQNFVSTETFGDILSESRKYRLCLALAHQYIDQLDEELRKAIFGNVGTIIAFLIGAENGEFLRKEFYPEFDREDLINHDKYHVYLKLAIDGKTSKPFSALTLPPFYSFKFQGNKDKILKVSRQGYSVLKVKTEEKI